MKFSAASTVAALLGIASAGSNSNQRTFAVLRFTNKALTMGMVDPIVNPGTKSGHVHVVQGGSNFGPSSTGADLLNSKCTNSKIKGDNSNYWFPRLHFRDPATGKLEPVDVDYVNVYYL
jgi:Domain of unknown function (DUF1996)